MRALLESKHLAKLTTLRLPYNGLSDAQALDLCERLRKGLAPALRMLDLSNVFGTTASITAAVAMNRNTVAPETEAAIARVLAERWRERATVAVHP